MNQYELIERAVQTFQVPPSILIGKKIVYVCVDCTSDEYGGELPDDFMDDDSIKGVAHTGLIVGWKCTEEKGLTLTVEDEELRWHEIPHQLVLVIHGEKYHAS